MAEAAVRAEAELAAIGAAFQWYPYKGIERFYDVGGILAVPELRKATTAELVRLVRAVFPDVTMIAGLDARGFLLAPGIADALDLPLCMIRKIGKMPNAVNSGEYAIEYGRRAGLGVQQHVVGKHHKVLIVDDLVATGGSLSAAIKCVQAVGATVEGCLTLVELEAFREARAKTLSPLVGRAALFADEAALLRYSSAAALPPGYRDDGKE